MKIKKRWWLSIVIVSVLVCAHLMSRFFLQSEFNRRVETLAKEGFPVSLDELEKTYVLPEGVPNAADIYIQAFSQYQEPTKSEEEYLPIRGVYEASRNEPPFPPKVIDTIKSSLAANQKTLELLDKAAEIKYCRWPRIHEDYSFSNDYYNMIETVSYLLSERNLYYAQVGEAEKLFKSIQSSMALAGTFSVQPFSIDYSINAVLKSLIVVNLEDVLSQVYFDESQLKLLQDQLMQMQTENSLYKALINEQCSTIEFWHLPGNKLDEYLSMFMGDKWQYKHPNLTIMLYEFLGFRLRDKILSLEFFEKFIEASQFPLHEQIDAYSKIRGEIDAYSKWHLYLTNYYGLIYTTKVRLRAFGQLCCAETALAIERYRLKYDALPESLESLVPEFIEAVPLEPFDGQPLRYIRYEDGYTVYTIGEDGVDNGGWSREQMAEETGEGEPEEYDWPFTVRR